MIGEQLSIERKFMNRKKSKVFLPTELSDQLFWHEKNINKLDKPRKRPKGFL